MQIPVHVRAKITIEVIVNMLTRRSEYQEFNLVVGDNGPPLEFKFLNEDGTPFTDFTGVTMKFFLKQYGSDGSHINSGHEAITITNPTAGLGSYSFVAGDLANEGIHFGEVQYVKGGVTFTLPISLRFNVRAQNE